MQLLMLELSDGRAMSKMLACLSSACSLCDARMIFLLDQALESCQSVRDHLSIKQIMQLWKSCLHIILPICWQHQRCFTTYEDTWNNQFQILVTHWGKNTVFVHKLPFWMRIVKMWELKESILLLYIKIITIHLNFGAKNISNLI